MKCEGDDDKVPVNMFQIEIEDATGEKTTKISPVAKGKKHGGPVPGPFLGQHQQMSPPQILMRFSYMTSGSFRRLNEGIWDLWRRQDLKLSRVGDLTEQTSRKPGVKGNGTTRVGSRPNTTPTWKSTGLIFFPPTGWSLFNDRMLADKWGTQRIAVFDYTIRKKMSTDDQVKHVEVPPPAQASYSF